MGGLKTSVLARINTRITVVKLRELLNYNVSTGFSLYQLALKN